MDKANAKLVTEIRIGDDLFKSNGFSYVKVTKNGVVQTLKIPIKSSGITELIEEFKAKEPRPPVTRELVKADSDLGRAMGLTKNTWVKMPDLSDPDYIKRKEKYESDLGIAIVLKGLDLKLLDENGNEITDRQKKIDALKAAGLSGEQFTQIVSDIRELTSWKEEEKENFFDSSLETT
ncbi:MAG: hypothetical protein DRI01_00550 [Chloroflexi bacterium]|nr:MAG: hypothetical protein DRI01_00550 [Chloroflexota bacterium]